MYCVECECQEDVSEKAFDSVVTRAPCLPVLVLMGNDESTGGCEKAPLPWLLRTPCLRFPISTGVEVCSLAAGHSGSVLTKLCLFPGLQGSQGKPGSRGETNKKAPLSHTLKPLSNTFVFSTQRGTFLFLGEQWQKETSFLETEPRDNKTAVVLSYVFFLCLNAILSCCLW